MMISSFCIQKFTICSISHFSERVHWWILFPAKGKTFQNSFLGITQIGCEGPRAKIDFKSQKVAQFGRRGRAAQIDFDTFYS